jgi:hypothetical protein
MDIFKDIPAIDWSRFVQGPVSDSMWLSFMSLVQLCRCVEHWHNTARTLRAATRPRQPDYKPATSYAIRKLRNEWEKPIKDYEARMHRASYLANEKLAEMSHLAGDEGTPDWKLCTAAVLSIGPSLGRARSRYKSVALAFFDAAELANTEPDVIASLWLNNAGYTNQEPHL